MSLDHVKSKGRKDKKVLVAVTDGNDNSSVIALENLVKSAEQSEVLIYAVGLLSEEARREANRARKALETLAEATGGAAYFPKELAEVDRIAHRWRGISATSTRSCMRRRMRRWMAPSVRLRSQPGRREIQ